MSLAKYSIAVFVIWKSGTGDQSRDSEVDKSRVLQPEQVATTTTRSLRKYFE